VIAFWESQKVIAFWESLVHSDLWSLRG